jgi:hypothetical protein
VPVLPPSAQPVSASRPRTPVAVPRSTTPRMARCSRSAVSVRITRCASVSPARSHSRVAVRITPSLPIACAIRDTCITVTSTGPWPIPMRAQLKASTVGAMRIRERAGPMRRPQASEPVVQKSASAPPGGVSAYISIPSPR